LNKILYYYNLIYSVVDTVSVCCITLGLQKLLLLCRIAVRRCGILLEMSVYMKGITLSCETSISANV